MKVSILIAYFKITSYQCRIVFTQRLSLFRLQIQSPFVSLKCTWEDKKSQNACKSYTSFSYFWMLLAVLGDTQETAGECKRENDRFLQNSLFFGIAPLSSMEEKIANIYLNAQKQHILSVYTRL